MASAFATNWNNKQPGVAWNDIYIDAGGNLATVETISDLEQSVVQGLQLWKGEYNYNTFLGVPYRLILGNPNIQQNLVIFYLTAAILNTNNYLTPAQLALYGIKKVVSITFNFDRLTRTDAISAIIQLNNGANINISA